MESFLGPPERRATYQDARTLPYRAARDPVIGHDFVLINHLEDESLEPFAQYLTNVGNSSILATRDWKDCERLSTAQWAACNTAHGISGAVQSIGTATLGAFINDEVNNAFTDGRDNWKLRSICHVYDGDNICLSWANYDTNTLKNGESGDIGGFAAARIKKGWSSELKATDCNNGVIYICVSNRATGCGSGVCGQ
ncbi:sequence orphan [Pseudozyma hubeiensis SY62]|uniref:Sequence orphan n=1 Tax=Pseudozyma hubeiensis (strain SY62) TaxID=1305764 RepID=R9P533_PSEHS|nr:sequence orphan [Pseudozyma hubeiensis SY62]GAC96553.1 sequence orphan [Pseudozyma hubeiensis SY62]